MTALSRLILSSIFLLLAGPVGAAELILPDDWVTPCWEKAPNSSIYYPCAVDVLINKGWLEQRHLAWIKSAQQVQLTSQESCLAQMEAAMRAMEPWVSITGYGSMQAYERGRVDGIMAESPDEMKRLVERFVTATKPLIMQWNEAKRDCWREKQ